MAILRNRKELSVVPILAGILIAVGGLLIPIWQGYWWLRHGMWPEIPLRVTWIWLDRPFPEFQWIGVQKIADWIFDQATSTVMVVIGAALAMWGGYLAR